MAVFEMTVSQFMPMSEPGSTSSIIGEVVFQRFLITETIKINKIRRILTQHINIGQTMKIRTSKRNLTINQTLSMWGRSSHGPSRTVTQIFPMWQKARTVKHQIIQHTLKIIQSISNYRFHGVYQTLVLNQVIISTMKRNVTLIQTLQMNSDQNAYQSNRDDCYVAHPYTLGGPNGSADYVF